MEVVEFEDLMKALDVTTDEALRYTMYFDYVREKSEKRLWQHYGIRQFYISISYLGGGYYAVVRRVRGIVQYDEVKELEKFEWDRAWIFRLCLS